MCGIIGYVGKKEVVPVLLTGLKALEYRGYDSSGVAVCTGASLSVVKRAGRIAELEKALRETPLTGHAGIGHTRWATHGIATDLNAHPFVSTHGKFAVVHNGIISNYLSLAAFLREHGVRLVSDTDSEVIAHLVDLYYTGDVFSAIRRAVRLLKGSFALGMISVYEPDVIYGVRKDSPLVVGRTEGGFALCSDISGISDFCEAYCPLDNGEIVRLTKSGVKRYDFEGREGKISFSPREKEECSDREAGVDDMLSEIRQTPMALLLGQERFPREKVRQMLSMDFDEILLVGCGSAYHAGLAFREGMREIAGTEIRAEIASEYLTQRPRALDHTLVVAVSQSGETADTLLAVEKAKRCGAKILSVCNVEASSLVRLSDLAVITRCGRERAVAATKSYVSQVHSLMMICLEYADIKGKIAKKDLVGLWEELRSIPDKAEQVVREEAYLADVAMHAKDAEAIFFLGRGADYAAAREGSLKLKEVSYLFSEAYPSGELKHGTLALMEEGVFGLIVATDPALVEKNAATVAEIVCRGASSVVIATEEIASDVRSDYIATIPSTHPIFSPMLSAIVMQQFAYFVAKARGCDVDRPRNLAKSVTVE